MWFIANQFFSRKTEVIMEITEQPILTVTEISLSLKACVEQIFSHVRIRGEVVGIKKASSGHTYFSLKDSESVLSAVCWRGRDKITQTALEEGLEIICTGKISTYPGRSNYQIIVEHAEPAGVGALMKLLADRKEKLAKEGLFDISHKKPIPYLPEIIGVITSPSGAVIQDIMHRLSDRFPRHVFLWPVLVQGEGAAEQIAAAINGFNAIPQEGIPTQKGKIILRPNLLIVARGGGSFEDLWCFNEEIVVRATVSSQIPIISAVGHETDTTLIDYAADLRAPTPTGAAEKSVPVRNELSTSLAQTQLRMFDAMYRFLSNNQEKIKNLAHSIPRLNNIINTFFEHLDDKTERLKYNVSNYQRVLENKLELLTKLLHSYSYNTILERGFSLVTDTKGNIVSSFNHAQKETVLNITFSDGRLEVSPVVLDTKNPSLSPKTLNNTKLKIQQKKTINKYNKDLFSYDFSKK